MVMFKTSCKQNIDFSVDGVKCPLKRLKGLIDNNK